jgi:hypothetical protein
MVGNKYALRVKRNCKQSKLNAGRNWNHVRSGLNPGWPTESVPTFGMSVCTHVIKKMLRVNKTGQALPKSDTR